jgi:DNA polymerase-3 subunit epsilon
MMRFTYRPDDRIARITGVSSSFNEAQNPIPAEITDLTGITDEMVIGHRIDPEAVAAFAADARIVIAHNANFDRKFAERYWPLFEQKAWACSATEVEWRKHGLTDRGWGTCWLVLACFTRRIERLTTAMPWLKSSLLTFRK